MEVEKQNRYERDWKMKTNMNKFAVISVSRRKTHEFLIERRKMEYKDKVKILGFKLRITKSRKNKNNGKIKDKFKF